MAALLIAAIAVVALTLVWLAWRFGDSPRAQTRRAIRQIDRAAGEAQANMADYVARRRDYDRSARRPPTAFLRDLNR
jgi:hypothetical protein